MPNGVLCNSWGFSVFLSLFYRLGPIHFPFCLKFWFVVLIMTFYRKCRVSSYYFVVLLNQTTEVKTLPIAHVAQFHNSGSVRAEAHVRAWIIPFGIRDTTKLTLCMVFSWYFPFLCQYPHTNSIYSHSDHRPRHTISQFYTVFNQNICLCLP